MRDGKVLLQRKRGDEVWALPGGKVEAGETPAAALQREFMEELGWEVRVGGMLWSFENCFTHDGADFRQDELYFAVSCDSALGPPRENALEFRWVSRAELSKLDLRPATLCRWLFRG
jgi:8-oxo-dGTP pyrophosphatase MutT (NUDIX family)